MSFKEKYLKYKKKYLDIKNLELVGGANAGGAANAMQVQGAPVVPLVPLIIQGVPLQYQAWITSYVIQQRRNNNQYEHSLTIPPNWPQLANMAYLIYEITNNNIINGLILNPQETTDLITELANSIHLGKDNIAIGIVVGTGIVQNDFVQVANQLLGFNEFDTYIQQKYLLQQIQQLQPQQVTLQDVTQILTPNQGQNANNLILAGIFMMNFACLCAWQNNNGIMQWEILQTAYRLYNIYRRIFNNHGLINNFNQGIIAIKRSISSYILRMSNLLLHTFGFEYETKELLGSNKRVGWLNNPNLQNAINHNLPQPQQQAQTNVIDGIDMAIPHWKSQGDSHIYVNQNTANQHAQLQIVGNYRMSSANITPDSSRLAIFNINNNNQQTPFVTMNCDINGDLTQIQTNALLPRMFPQPNINELVTASYGSGAQNFRGPETNMEFAQFAYHTRNTRPSELPLNNTMQMFSRFICKYVYTDITSIHRISDRNDPLPLVWNPGNFVHRCRRLRSPSQNLETDTYLVIKDMGDNIPYNAFIIRINDHLELLNNNQPYTEQQIMALPYTQPANNMLPVNNIQDMITRLRFFCQYTFEINYNNTGYLYALSYGYYLNLNGNIQNIQILNTIINQIFNANYNNVALPTIMDQLQALIMNFRIYYTEFNAGHHDKINMRVPILFRSNGLKSINDIVRFINVQAGQVGQPILQTFFQNNVNIFPWDVHTKRWLLTKEHINYVAIVFAALGYLNQAGQCNYNANNFFWDYQNNVCSFPDNDVNQIIFNIINSQVLIRTEIINYINLPPAPQMTAIQLAINRLVTPNIRNNNTTLRFFSNFTGNAQNINAIAEAIITRTVKILHILSPNTSLNAQYILVAPLPQNQLPPIAIVQLPAQNNMGALARFLNNNYAPINGILDDIIFLNTNMADVFCPNNKYLGKPNCMIEVRGSHAVTELVDPINQNNLLTVQDLGLPN